MVVGLGRIRWVPVTLSFSRNDREKKDPHFMTSIAKRVEHLDVKTIAAWVDGETSHAVAAKRNTSIGLRALVSGKPIVTAEFLSAIVEAAKAPPPDPTTGQLQYCPLELDFDANFPDAAKYLPPKGSEPGNHSADLYKPDQRRMTLFDGWTFVLCEKKQFDALSGPITAAGGKTTIFHVVQDSTIPYELTKHVQGLGLENVAVVRGKYDNVDWGDNFYLEVEKM